MRIPIIQVTIQEFPSTFLSLYFGRETTRLLGRPLASSRPPSLSLCLRPIRRRPPAMTTKSRCLDQRSFGPPDFIHMMPQRVLTSLTLTHPSIDVGLHFDGRCVWCYYVSLALMRPSASS